MARVIATYSSRAAMHADFLKRVEGFDDVRTLNIGRSNTPVDLLAQDGKEAIAIEVKGGLVSNGSDAQKWRITLGQPSKSETQWLQRATAKEKAEHNADKQLGAVVRKSRFVTALSRELKRPIKKQEITVIIDPDRRLADVYVFADYHEVIRWKSKEAQTAYVGSYSY